MVNNKKQKGKMKNPREMLAKEFKKEVPYQKQLEDYKKPKLFVATPCYAGQVHVKYMESIMALQHELLQKGVGFEFFNIPFDSLIPRARNACVTRFMTSSNCTHLLFVDADIQFHPSSVVKMLQENKDIIAGCYPKKAIDFAAIKQNYSKTENQVELVQSAVKYAYNLKPQKTHKLERGVVEVLDAPTGFMMIKKTALRQLIAHYYKDLEYHNDVRAYQITAEDRFFDLFQSQVFDRRYLSEDYGFCRLWQNIGGLIHADLTVKLNHIGQFCYYGDPLVHLKYSNNVEITQHPSGSSQQNDSLPSVQEEPIVQIPVIEDDGDDDYDEPPQLDTTTTEGNVATEAESSQLDTTTTTTTATEGNVATEAEPPQLDTTPTPTATEGNVSTETEPSQLDTTTTTTATEGNVSEN